MPTVPAFFHHDALSAALPHLAPRALLHDLHELHNFVKRINITIGGRYGSADPALVAASKQDPWRDSGKYALGWVAFALVLLGLTVLVRLYHMWMDKLRRAVHKERMNRPPAFPAYEDSPDDYEMKDIETPSSAAQLYPPARIAALAPPPPEKNVSMPMLDRLLGCVRWLVYRPIPSIRLSKKSSIVLPSIGVLLIAFAALAFTVLYSVLPQPLFYATPRFGSPPLAIRAGMLSVAMVPWIVALSMKANLVSFVTGIGHERLNALHRWGGYVCLALAIIHTVPFYIQPVWTDGALPLFQSLYQGQPYIYGTGIAAIAPLAFLCIHSLPYLRRRMYEVFIVMHTPVALVFLGTMIWHCQNFLTSWHYLFATLGMWAISLIYRLAFLNWARPNRLSWLCGEECSIVLLPENAIKVTIPTQLRWYPGQFVYLRIPGISFFENHPFTIASLCSDDLPSDYGDAYRDAILVFRPFGGFTRKVLTAAVCNGPYHTYRAFLDGPYGGMRRELAAFDTVVMIAGGSGITSIVSHLLLLIQKMRAGAAIVRQVHVIWALKRPDTAAWFREELRICRAHAPDGSVHCRFFVTAAKRLPPDANLLASPPPNAGTFAAAGQDAAGMPRPNSFVLHERVNDAFQGIADKRASALISEAAGGDRDLKRELVRENEDSITALPEKAPITSPRPAHLSPPTQSIPYFPPPPGRPAPDGPGKPAKAQRRARPTSMRIEIPDTERASGFDFGFPATPTALQKSLVRFAFMPGAAGPGIAGRGGVKTGWNTEYGRPDIPYMLRELRPGFGRRACVFVCGPESMREDVQRCVAGMQSGVARGGVEEIFLHTENYAI